MSVGYVTVQWSAYKRAYDLVLAAGIFAYLIAFIGVTSLLWRPPHEVGFPVLMIRATGTCAIVLLHVILAIGPLCRLDRRFLPILYNRRHLGVATFLVALLHGGVVLGYYHGFGKVNPLVSILLFDNSWRGDGTLPFQVLGFAALIILFLMAATSHDFWLKNLSAQIWKGLHMLVYVAYALLVLHVTFGALQAERSNVYVVLLLAGFAVIAGLHLAAGVKEKGKDRQGAKRDGAWFFAALVDEIADGSAKGIVLPNQERVAIFRKGDRLHAIRGVCAHQGGPLAEGRIIDGCLTCPWHGWQYRPEDGCSPPPFVEKIATYRLKREGDRVLIDPMPLEPGTAVDGVTLEEKVHG